MMAELIGLEAGKVEEPKVPQPSDPEQLLGRSNGEASKDGVEPVVTSADNEGASDTSPPQPAPIDSSPAPTSSDPPLPSAPQQLPQPQTPHPIRPIESLMLASLTASPPPPPATTTSTTPPAPPHPPSLTSTHSHPTTSLSLSSNAPPPSAPSLSTSPSSTDTQTLASARAALEATILSTGSTYTHPIEARARDLHAMNTALATQQSRLLSATGALARENDRLVKVAEEGARRLKEVGALDVWAEVLEGDLAAVEECLKIVEGGGEESCESCGGDLGGVEEWGVRWCGGCDGLWHAGCCGEEGGGEVAEGDGVEGLDEWRCRECALREDLEAMVGELGGFVDDEMDTSGEIAVEPPREEMRYNEGREEVMEDSKRWKGKGVVYLDDGDVQMGDDGGDTREDAAGDESHTREETTGNESYVREDITVDESYTREETTGNEGYVREDITVDESHTREETTGNEGYAREDNTMDTRENATVNEDSAREGTPADESHAREDITGNESCAREGVAEDESHAREGIAEHKSSAGEDITGDEEDKRDDTVTAKAEQPTVQDATVTEPKQLDPIVSDTMDISDNGQVSTDQRDDLGVNELDLAVPGQALSAA